MTHHAFVCWALTAPMIVPVLAFPLLRVERDPFDSIAQLLVGSLVVGLVPYLVFAAHDPKAGMSGSLANLVQHPRLNHRVQLTAGVLADEAGEVLRTFFRARRRSRVNPQDTAEPAEAAGGG